MLRPSGRFADRLDGRAELGEHLRRDLIRRAVRAVEHDRKSAQAERGRHGRLAELGVARGGVLDADHLADRFGVDRRELGFELALDRVLDVVVELLAGRREELDAVVLVRIVRSADHDAGARAQAARQIRDGRRRHRAEQAHVRAGGDEARFERGFEHVAGHARVLADDDGRLAVRRGQHGAGGAAELEHELRGDRPFADAAADAVGSEIFALAHVDRPSHARVLACQTDRAGARAVRPAPSKKQTPREAGRRRSCSKQWRDQSPICFCRCSQRSCASRLSVAIGRASRRSMPISSSVSSQYP